MTSNVIDRHFRNSTYREKIVEHIFVGELLRYFWKVGLTNVEILKPEVDVTGYDLVVMCGSIIRHIQIKTSIINGKTKKQNVNAALATQPSGCVVWIMVDDDLSFNRFLWFGGLPGDPLPSLADFKMSKNPRADAQGVKHQRENTKILLKGQFKVVDNMGALVDCLFGDTDQGHSVKLCLPKLDVRALK